MSEQGPGSHEHAEDLQLRFKEQISQFCRQYVFEPGKGITKSFQEAGMSEPAGVSPEAPFWRLRHSEYRDGPLEVTTEITLSSEESVGDQKAIGEDPILIQIEHYYTHYESSAALELSYTFLMSGRTQGVLISRDLGSDPEVAQAVNMQATKLGFSDVDPDPLTARELNLHQLQGLAGALTEIPKSPDN